MSLAHYVTVGQSGLRVSPLCLDMLAAVPSFAFGGTTVNGQPSAVFPLAPKNDSERF